MALKTDAELLAEAQVIRDETTTDENTATRVGGHMVNGADSKINKQVNIYPLSGGFVPGSYIPIWNDTIGRVESIPAETLQGSTDVSIYEYDNVTNYVVDEVVTHLGLWYQALAINGPGSTIVEPGTNGAVWDEISKALPGVLPWEAGAYIEDEVFVLAQVAGVWGLYHLIDAARPYMSTDFDAELTALDWEIVGGGSGGAVDSVNGQTGVVVLNATDVGADPTGSAAAVASNLSAHIADATDAHAGTAITNTPAGGIAAANVQAALNELDTDKVAKAGDTMSGNLAMGANKVTGLAEASANGDAVRYEQLVSVNTNVKKRLGDIFSKTLVAGDSSLYTDTSPQTTFTFTAGGITASGGNNDALNFLEYTNYYTNVHKWSREIIFTPTSDGDGIGIGIHSANGDQLARMIATGANKGKILIDTFRTATLTNRITSTAALTYTNTTDQLKLTFEKSYTNYRVTVQIVGTPASIVSVEWIDTLAYPTVSSVWAVGRPAIFHFGGDQTITSDKYTVNEYVQNQVATFSASLGAGAYAADVDNMWGVILNKSINEGVSIVAGGGNLTSSWTNAKNEILSLKPKIIVFDQGLNDVINSIPLATSQANITGFIQDCLANNITPLLCDLTYAAGTSSATINTFNSWLNGLGYVKIIPVNAAMSVASALNSLYDAGDGIHFNALGNKIFAQTVQASLKSAANITQSPLADAWNANSAIIYTLTNYNASTGGAISFRVNNASAVAGITTYSTAYTGVTGYAGKTIFSNSGVGVIVGATGGSGTIQFIAGGTSLSSDIRMTITTSLVTITGVTTVTGTLGSAAFTATSVAATGVVNLVTAVQSGGTTNGSRVLANCGNSTYLQSNSTSFTPTGGMIAGDCLVVATGTRLLVGCTNASGTIEFGVGASFTVGGLMISSGLWRFGDNTTPTAYVDCKAGTTTVASLRIRTGVAPTTPNDGDIWQDGTDIKIRIGGVTKTFTLI